MARNAIRIGSSPTVETGAGRLANKRWVQLLTQIETTHSIAAAARAIGLSYKAAWDAVDTMNNQSDRPLVLRSKGGKGGGGAQLTARGQQLVATFGAVEAEHTHFLKSLNARIRNPKNLSQDMRVIGRLNMQTSARNQFSGKVVRIKKGAVNDEIALTLPGGEKLVAIITHESTQSLGLKVGVEVVALVKASWVIVGIGDDAGLKLSARNQLRGVIRRLTAGAVNAEVVIELKGGTSVAAIITNVAAKELRLAVGKPACAIFKASSVILGVTN